MPGILFDEEAEESVGASQVREQFFHLFDPRGSAHFAAVWRAVADTIIPGKVIGKAIFGTLFSDRRITRSAEALCEGAASGALSDVRILTVQGEISLVLGPDTDINCPTGTASGIGVAGSAHPVRVAVLADRSPGLMCFE